MPITSPSSVTSGPPELPGFTAASNWMRLVSRRDVVALQAGDDAGGNRRADAERKSHRHHFIAGAQPGGGTHDRRHHVVGQALCLQHGEIVLGPLADERRFGIEPVEEGDVDAPRALHDMQVGEDEARVDDDHARAALPVGFAGVHALRALLAVVGHGAHCNHRREDLFVGLRRRRRRRRGVERVLDDGLDVLLAKARRLHHPHRADQKEDPRRERRDDEAPPGKAPALRRRRRRGGRQGRRNPGCAVERASFHGATRF